MENRYNHEEDNIDKAVNLDVTELFDSLNNILNSKATAGFSFSQRVEKIEATYDQKSLAVLVVMLARSLSDSNERLDTAMEKLLDNPMVVGLDASKIPTGLKDKLDKLMKERGDGVGISMGLQDFKDSGLMELLNQAKDACMCPVCTERREAGEAGDVETVNAEYINGEGGHA